MCKSKLNSLVVTYQKTSSNENFREIMECCREFNQKQINGMSRKYGLDRQDVEGVVYWKIYDVSNRYDRQKGDFLHQISREIKRACIDIYRKNQKLKVQFNYYVDENGQHVDIFENMYIQSVTADAEQEMIDYLIKECDQRQLIATLYEQANEKCREALIAYSVSNSFLDAAKRLGIDNQTVQRRIRKISTYFNANQSGDITDYFTVPTRQIS
ncbi:DNA-directed RNA polymerase specialized sigma24 family protein [Virgibacillus halotolerans]|uniref:RNA polymerase sigma factor n=1 Tax=Virgibacillus halotolerans TaxID=1071053 RepID=UPI00195FA3E5|nr:sigma-70 family RNA polymerase sigma factor [Virgibacillus halotolerans]MBM7600089.1 DNA-directed RNA polymerase specialized sigma24 family protein [Virgibacillus halotolerans]